MRHIITLLAVTISLSINAQYKFHTTLGTGIMSQDHQGKDIALDWNGGFYSIAEDMLGGISYLNRHGPEGSLVFSKFYDIAGTNRVIEAVTVNQADSTLMIVGTTSGTNGIFMLNTDSSGTAISYSEYTRAVSGNFNVSEVFSNSDGTFSVFGTLYECPGTCANYAYAVRMDAGGNILSFLTFNATDTNTDIAGVNQLSNGNYFLNLLSNNTVSSTDARHLMLVNPSGTVISQTAYESGGSGIFVNPFQGMLHSNGNYYVVGSLISVPPATSNGDYGMIMELNSSLALQDIETMQYASGGAYITNAFENSLGEIETTGIVFNGPLGDQDAMRTTFDPSGLSLIETNVYGTAAANEMFKSLRASDGGMLSMGSDYDSGPGVSKAEFFKFDSNGEIGCNSTDITLSTNAFSVSLTSVPLTVQSGSLTRANLTVNESVYSVTETIYCSSPSCAIDVVYSKQDVDCNGNSTGSVTLNVTGVSGSETYSWTGPNGFMASTANISSLEAGVYNLTITDGTCTEMVVATINEPNALSLSYTSANPSCTGDNDGSINMTISGGTSPFTQTWTGPNSYTSSLEDINGLLAGTYNVTVNDANGCTTTGQVILIDPPALTVTLSTNSVSCNGGNDGTASAFATGGTPGTGYTFSWSNGQTNQTAINLIAGTYSVTVTDANGCAAMASGLVGEPLALSVSVNTTPSACNLDDGSADAIVTGGTSPFNYTWSSGGSGSTETGLAGGSYTLDVTDANGCAANQESFVIGDTTYGVELCVIMVDTSSSMNELVWEKPGPAGISGFNIYRDVVGTYTLIDFWPYDSISQYVDSSAGINPNNTSYRYKISVVDSCGGESELSNYHETIHVQLNIGGGQANLIWDEYEGFTFGYYRIMKDSLGNNNWQVLDSVSSTNFTYTDQNPGLDTRYRVDVIIPSQCTSTRANHNTTRSNRTQPANGGSQNGVGELSAHIFEVYPNPSTGDININHSANTNAELLVYTGDGRLLEIIPINRIQGLIHLDYVPGMYVLSLRDENGVTSRRVVIK